MDRIAEAIKARRTSMGWSLRELGTRAGVSASLLSQIETGKSQPSVNTLYALVNVLGLSLDEVLVDAPANPAGHEEAQQPVAAAGGLSVVGADFTQVAAELDADDRPHWDTVMRPGTRPTLELESGVVWEKLTDSADALVDCLLVTYQPGGSSSSSGKLTQHTGVEYAYLLEGTLSLQLEFTRHVLRPGDSLSFDSSRPHLYRNESDRPARGVWFVLGRRPGGLPPAALQALGLSTDR
ncbi:helix-turn-helix domain-containing protein [Kineococcus aurantiacus]|uniref:Transcriptional regulator with XRE-family HTH domain/quercetin dioxygenase-like cupin family protein n=1 Tax=Kineococcus aurantiacus TaxID=37633 RepID=A0A7Y9J323_9ACTN|nr:helix-turn-helix domain-containing protein [Kineococcus aurantiacus]NYD24877.1 transcriptional regulator with XRE-family HTH domain/quercetin dioxygenase-like cupin family protein [Kineococcus aurantiacus]